MITETSLEIDAQEELYLDGAMYMLRADGKWEKTGETIISCNPIGFGYKYRSICPDLANFTYAGVDKLDDDNTNQFTAPTCSGEPYSEDPPVGGEGRELRDWEIWVDEDGYILKMTYRFVGAKWDDLSHTTPDITLLNSGHGEANVLPYPNPME